MTDFTGGFKSLVFQHVTQPNLFNLPLILTLDPGAAFVAVA